MATAAVDLDREIVLTPPASDSAEDRAITRVQRELQRPDARPDAWERLAWAYIAKARRTLDPGYYTLAEKAADVLEAAHGTSPESSLVRGHVLHNLHRFRAAESLARRVVAQRGTPADLALLSDVLVELGQLSEAIEVLQRLLNLKPGAEAFSRVSHVRWLKGDLEGAQAALTAALRATDARDHEVRAWLLCRKAAIHLQRGERTAALAVADAALLSAADFPPALLVRGKSLLTFEREAEAVTVLSRAEALNPTPEYQWWLADALDAAGRTEAAGEVRERLRRKGAAADPRTVALYLATRGEDVSSALSIARREFADRGDVFSHDALAWAQWAAGDLAAAQASIRAALGEGTRDARLDLHAGEIAHSLGQPAEAARHFARAREAESMLTPTERELLRRRLSAKFSGAAAGTSHHPLLQP